MTNIVRHVNNWFLFLSLPGTDFSSIRRKRIENTGYISNFTKCDRISNPFVNLLEIG